MSKNIFGIFATFNNQEYRKKIEAAVNDIFKKEDVISLEKFKSKSIWKDLTKNADEATLNKIESIFALDNDSSTISKNEFNLLFRLMDEDSENNFDNDYKTTNNNSLKNISEDDMEYYYNLTVKQADNINKPSLKIGSFKKNKDNAGNSLGTIVVNINDKELVVNIDKSITANGNFRTEDKYNTGKTYPDTDYIEEIVQNMFNSIDEQSLADLANHIDRIELMGLDTLNDNLKQTGLKSAHGYYNFEDKKTINLSMEKIIGISSEDNNVSYHKTELSYKELANNLKHELSHALDFDNEPDSDNEIIPYTSGIENDFRELKSKLEEFGINSKQFYLLENQEEYLAEYNSFAYKDNTENSYNKLINELQERLKTETEENKKQKIRDILESVNNLNEECNIVLDIARNK